MKQRCYFHKHQYIENFCVLKECTLPLCVECMAIHESEHRQKGEEAQIISYTEAYDQVCDKIGSYVRENTFLKQKLTNKLRKDKQQAVQMLQKYFKQSEQKVQSQFKNLNEVQNKFQKLKKGSIKSVIYYFSGELDLTPNEMPQIKQISNSLRKLIDNAKSEKNQQIQTFRRLNTIQNQFQHLHIDVEEKPNKKTLLTNEKKYSHSPIHKNTNGPYLDHQISKNQNRGSGTYTNLYHKYQWEKTQQSKIHQNLREQPHHMQRKTQIQDVFHPYKQNLDLNRNILQENQREKVQIEHINQQTDFRRTLDRYPSMNQFTKKPKQSSNFNNQEDNFVGDSKYSDLQPGKWNKNNANYEKTKENTQRPRSTYSQLSVHEPQKSTNRQYTNESITRKPLKTSDLQPYKAPQDNVQLFEARQRAVSHQIGLRTTVSQSVLPSNRKIQPFINQNLKRQVLSPLQIRKMLQKKIQERNKVLTEKKQFNLKVNTDRKTSHNPSGMTHKYEHSKISNQDSPKKYQDQNARRGFVQSSEQKSYGYNTKDSIINQIYRQSRY